MNNFLQELGYRINYKTLRSHFEKGTGKKLTRGDLKFYGAVAPYLVIAYTDGLEGKSLARRFPFLEVLK